MRAVPLLVLIIPLLATAAPQTPAGDDDVDKHINNLGNTSPQVRRLAAEFLGKLGPKAEPAIPSLVMVLGDDDADVSREAGTALLRVGVKSVPVLAKAVVLETLPPKIKIQAAALLRRFGKQAKAAVPALASALTDKGVDIRIHAAGALRAIGPDAKEALPALIAACKDTGNIGDVIRAELPSSVCEAAVQAVQAIDPAALDAAAKAAVPDLIAALKVKDEGTRLAAIHALFQLGPRAKDAVTELRNLYVQGKGLLALDALRTLGACGPAGRKALVEIAQDPKAPATKRLDAVRELGASQNGDKAPIDELRQLLKDQQPHIRLAAIQALLVLGPRAKEAVADLVAEFEDDAVLRLPSADIGDDRYLAARALAAVGPPAVPALTKALESDKIMVRWQAAKALAHLGRQAKSAVPQLKKTLEDSYALVTVESACALIRAGEDPKAPLAVLAANLQHASAAIREFTMDAVQRVGVRAASLAPLLEKLIDDDDSWPTAVQTLCKLGPEGRRAVPKLAQVLADPKSPTRFAALRLVESLGPDAKDAVPVLTNLLRDKDASMARVAVTALGRVGPGAKAAVTALIEQLKSKDDEMRWGAMQALGRIGPDAKAAVPALAGWLQAKADADRGYAAQALGRIGPAAKDALPALEKLLTDPNRSVRVWTLFAVARIKGDEKPALDPLIAMYQEPNAGDAERGAIVDVLQEFGPAARKGLPLLIDAAKGPALATADTALTAIGALGADAAEAVPALTELLGDRWPFRRAAAAWALGRIGPAAKMAVPRLTELLDQEQEVAEAAEEALARIQGKK